MAQRGHTGEESGQDLMRRFGEYGKYDVQRGESTCGTDLDHHDINTEREGLTQGNWVGGGDL